MTRDFYLTKKDSEKRVMFPATETDDGLLINPQGHPMVIGDEITAAGFKASDVQVPIAELADEIKPFVLRIGDNRGHLVERRETPSDRKARQKKERDAQNAFLREKGYRWEKRGVYHSNPGELVDAWFLLGPDGEVVCGWKDSIGEELASTGPSLKKLLTQLGYYGQEAIDKSEAKAKVSAERREMRAKVDAYFADDSNRTGETFENAESLFTVRPVSIEKHYPRRQFRIESDCIWKESHNRSDGDDWSLNNSDYGIATQYKYDQEIAEAIEFLSC